MVVRGGGSQVRTFKALFVLALLWVLYAVSKSGNATPVDKALLWLAKNSMRSGIPSSVMIDRSLIGEEPVLFPPVDGKESTYMLYDKTTGGELRQRMEAVHREALSKYELLDSSPQDTLAITMARNKFIIEATAKDVDMSMPHGDVTLVSGLWDLGRGELSNGFHRDLKEYTDGLKATFLYNTGPKILFLSAGLEAELREYIENEVVNIKVVVIDISDMRDWFGPAYEQKDNIRTSKEWSDAHGPRGWLAMSPQSKLKDYTTIVMYKMMLLRMAARSNPFNTESFVFIDSRHACHNPQVFVNENFGLLRKNMDTMMATHFDYAQFTETHGFKHDAFMKWLGLPQHSKHKVVRGGIFGGKIGTIEVVTMLYENILRGTLKDGYMGTEENIFSIILYRHEPLIHGFNNDNACYESTERDMSCEGFENLANFCAIFDFVNNGVIHRDGTRTRVIQS
eukprot:CFRG5809T1